MAGLIYNKDFIITMEEEVSNLARPANPFTNHFSLRPITGRIGEPKEVITANFADGFRQSRRKVTVSKTIDWSFELEVHPFILGWFLKWAGFSLTADSTNGHYRYLPILPGSEPKTFTIYADPQVASFYASGEQTLAFLGSKIEELTLLSSGLDADGRQRINLTGQSVQPLVDTGGKAVVLDYTGLSTKDIVIVVNGVTYTRTEGTDWTAATSNAATATSIATGGANPLNDITGITAIANSGVVTVAADTGYLVTAFRTDADISDMTAFPTTTDVLMGLPALAYAHKLLYNDQNPTAFMFKGSVVQWDSGGFLASNNIRSHSLSIRNTLNRIKYAEERTDFYDSQIFNGQQTFMVEFEQGMADASARLADYHQSTTRAFSLRTTHVRDRDATGNKYQVQYRYPAFQIDTIDEFQSFGGGEEETMRRFTGEPQVGELTVIRNNTTGSDHTLDIDTSFVAGSSGDCEAIQFTSQNGGYLEKVVLNLKSAASTTEVLTVAIFTDSSDEPVETTPVTGGISDTVNGAILTTSYQAISFYFPSRPRLEANTKYWIAIYSTGSGSGVLEIEGVVGGGVHRVTTDGGQTWAVADADWWYYERHMREPLLTLDLYVQTNATTLYPDAT